MSGAMVVHETDLKRDPREPKANLVKHDDRRGGIRMSPYWVRCDRGIVLDVSRTGARLLCRREPRGRCEMRFWDVKIGLNVVGDVVWARRVGFFQWEAGFQFTEMDEDLRSTLSAVVSHFHG